MTTTTSALDFDNRFADQLPADPNTSNTPRQVHNACYSRVNPTPVANPQLVAYSREVADLLELGELVDSAEFPQIFSGNQLLEGMDPYAMCYGGHQFGNWAGQLGDGRAINLGELRTSNGDHFALQLKGSGRTPYSRGADGLAVLRSSIREFLCSEAMHHLGVPTTRALSLVTTGEQVMRDMFYNGNAAFEKGAIVCRVAPSFIRFGNFQIFASRNELDTLRELVNFTIRTEFPHLLPADGEPTKETIVALFKEVVASTAKMIVEWMRVGFVHGVMNTDNLSILGLTIDYGPYGWLDDYDPTWTPNTTDAQHRRYRFGNQPQIGQWNLAQLGSSLIPLIEEVEPLQEAVNEYSALFQDEYHQMMAAKLGLRQHNEKRLDDLQEVLISAETDMTIFFRNLSHLPISAGAVADDELLAPLEEAYYQTDQLTPGVKAKIGKWLRGYRAQVLSEGWDSAERLETMRTNNPKYVLRNYMAQLAIDSAEQGDNTLVNDLLDLLRNPYDEQPEQVQWFAKRPDWARHRPGCSTLSCSS